MIADRDDDMSSKWWSGFMWGIWVSIMLLSMTLFGLNKYYAYKLKHAYDPIQVTMLGTVDASELSTEDKKSMDEAIKKMDLETQSKILDKYIEKKKNPIVRLWNKITKE